MKKKRPNNEEYPVGTVFNPLVVREDYLVRFVYDGEAPHESAIECRLTKEGTLEVRMSGAHSDLLATHHHVANACFVVPLRFSQEKMRYVELIREGSK